MRLVHFQVAYCCLVLHLQEKRTHFVDRIFKWCDSRTGLLYASG